jgi:hypothetical protein
MFKGFSIEKYKSMKPPSNNSFTTMQEVKEINSIPMNKSAVRKYDDIQKVFGDIAIKNKLKDYNPSLVNKIIKKSSPIIKKLKNHFDRPRPISMAKGLNIKMDYYKLPSMNTPSYPSGHSVQGILIGRILSDKHPHLEKEFMNAGKKISYSRRIAKAHYKSDSKVGELMGEDMYKHVKNKI